MLRKRDLKSLLLATQSPAVRLLKISSRVITLPSMVVYLVNRCNFHCVMCPLTDLNQAPLEKMDLSLLESLLDQAAALPIKPRIHFSGYGEPLVYQHFSDVIRYCNKKKLPWGITTNGYLLEKYAEEIVSSNCRDINISIHGGPEIHNRIVGVANGFEKAIAGIQALDRVKQAHHVQKPPMAINCVISHENVHQLPEILETFKALPVNSVTFQHLIFSASEMDEKKEFTLYTPEDLEAVFALKKIVDNNHGPFLAQFFPSLSDSQIWPYYTDKTYPAENTCVLPWLSTRVYPNGDVSLCEVFYGNLKDTPLKTLMNSQNARDFRKKVSQKAFSADFCFRCCHRQYT